MSTLRINTLGTVAFWHGDENITSQIPLKAQALLIYLAAQNSSLNRAVVADMFWREYDAHRARANLRMALGALRRLIPDHLIISRNHVSLKAGTRIDCFDFKLALQENQENPLVLQEILPQYQGEFLEGFFIDDAGDFEQWRSQTNNTLRVQRIQAYDTVIDYLTGNQEFEAALEVALQLYALDIEREASHRLLMQLYAASGNRHAALSQYDNLSQLLNELYGIEPSAETSKIYQEIRTGLGTTDAKNNHPKKSLAPLPQYPNPFIGREQAVTNLATILKNARLLTLIGIGGIGKTRLAIELGQQLAERFSGGVIFVPLQGTDPFRRLAEVLGLESGTGALLDLPVLAALQSQNSLLILDQFQVTVQNLDFVKRLLADAPQLRILVTSREPLNLYGEYRYPVPPLTVPTTNELENVGAALQYEAIGLFVRRVQETQPRFQLHKNNMALVAEICRRLDGIPFALELAAAQASVRSLEQLRDLRLYHLSAPHHANQSENTLFEMLEWSYETLSAEDAYLYRRLGLFTGGWTLETLESLFAGDVSSSLQSLLMRGLVWRQDSDEKRFNFLAPVREHARLKLQEANEELATREQYIHYYLNLAQWSSEGWQGIEQQEWLKRLDEEIENIRGILLYTQQNRNWHETHALLVGAMGWYWYVRTRHHEALSFAEKAIRLRGHISQIAYAGILATAGHAAFTRGDGKRAFAWHNEAVQVYRKLGDKQNEAFMLFCLSAHVTDFEEQRDYAEQALQLAKHIEVEWLIPHILVNIGERHRMRGEYSEARQLMQEGMALAKKLGNDIIRAYHLLNLCDVLISTGHHSLSRMYLKQGIALAEKLGDDYVLAEAYGLQSDCELAQKQIKHAEIWAERAYELALRLQNPVELSLAVLRKARVFSKRGRNLIAQSYLYEALLHWENQSLETGQQYEIWLMLCEAILGFLLKKTDYSSAARLYRYIENLRRECQVLRRPMYNEQYRAYEAEILLNAPYDVLPFSSHYEILLDCGDVLGGFNETNDTPLGLVL